MKINLKVFSIILVFTVIFVFAAGCDLQSPKEKTKESTATDTTSTESDYPEYLNPTGYPIVKTPITLKVMVAKQPFHADFNEIKVFTEYEKKSGIKIEWDQVPASNVSERVNIVLAAGDYPDAFLKCGMSNDVLLQYGSQGVFIAINDLMETYAPNFSKAIKQLPTVIKGITQHDGNIYGFPYINSISHVAVRKIFVNKTWLEAVDKPMPSTTEEFYEVLKAFRDNDPNKNGQKDEIPFTGQGGLNDVIRAFGGAFGLYNRGSSSQFDIDESTGEMRFVPIQPQYKELLQYLNRVYTEKLLDNEIMTNDLAKMAANLTSNISGVHATWVNQAGPYTNDYEAAPALKGPNGDQMWTFVSGTILGRTGFVITDKNKYPEASMRWVDYFYTDEGNREYFLGFEGETYEVTSDGKYELLKSVTNNPDGLSQPQVLGKYTAGGGGNNPAILNEKYFKAAEMHPVSQAGTQILLPYLPKEVWEPFTYTLDEIKQKQALNDINKYVNEMTAKFVSGQSNFSEWDNYVDTIKKMGLDDLMKIEKAAYDRYAKN